jgi:hypothetical protein
MTNKPNTFVDESANDTGRLSCGEPSAAVKGPGVSAPPTKGFLGNDTDHSDGGSNGDEELTESKPSSAGSDYFKIAAKEARFLLASKILVAFVLILSAGLLGYFSYALMRAEEESEFENVVS